jgi:hypothetical protein
LICENFGAGTKAVLIKERKIRKHNPKIRQKNLNIENKEEGAAMIMARGPGLDGTMARTAVIAGTAALSKPAGDRKN